jgi:hypothetical protein
MIVKPLILVVQTGSLPVSLPMIMTNDQCPNFRVLVFAMRKKNQKGNAKEHLGVRSGSE